MKNLKQFLLFSGVFCIFRPAPVKSIGLDPDLVKTYLKSIEVAEKRAATGEHFAGNDNFANFYLKQMGVAKRNKASNSASISQATLNKVNSRVFKDKFERFCI